MAVTACGGGEDDVGGRHDEFVAELNAICKEGNDQVAGLNAAASEALANSDFAELARTFGEASAAYGEFLPRLDRLDVPAEDAEAFRRYRETLDRQRRLVRRMAIAARNGRTGEIVSLAQAANTEAKQRLNAAVDLGADECGQSNVE